MPNVKFRTSRRTLTSHAGLSIIGQCVEIAGVDSIDSRFPTTLGMRTSDVVKSYLGLLCLGMSDYDAIENVRRDKPFQQLLTLQKVPSTATLRQRLDKLAANDLQTHTASWSTTLLSWRRHRSPPRRRMSAWISTPSSWTTATQRRKASRGPTRRSTATPRSPLIWATKGGVWAWSCVPASSTP
ncbi:hypothetical protein VRRI112168_18835 [Vreelandella rituensis]